MTKRLSDVRMMQIKENLLHGTFVYSHGLDLLDHISALEQELAEIYKRHSDSAEVFAEREAKLRTENARLREALEWYADGKTWLESFNSACAARIDRGQKARQALASTGETE